MTAETQRDGSIPQDGLVLSGMFVSARTQPGNDRPDGTKWPDKFNLTLLVGERTLQVEYRGQRECEAALGTSVDDLAPMERVEVPVGVRAAKGYVFYYGRNQQG